jgi:hypothetical protein
MVPPLFVFSVVNAKGCDRGDSTAPATEKRLIGGRSLLCLRRLIDMARLLAVKRASSGTLVIRKGVKTSERSVIGSGSINRLSGHQHTRRHEQPPASDEQHTLRF